MNLIGVGVAVVLLLGIVRTHLWQDHERNKKLDGLIGDNRVLTGNYDTCQQTNHDNVYTINRQRDSITEFIRTQDENMEHNRVLAEQLAVRQLADNEASRRSREEVRTILSAEACATVEHPPRVHRVLNDAIAKASVSQG